MLDVVVGVDVVQEAAATVVVVSTTGNDCGGLSEAHPAINKAKGRKAAKNLSPMRL